MTASIPAIRSISDWRRAYADCVTSPEELLHMLGLPSYLLPGARRASALFPLRVPRGYVARMQTGNPDDPLLRQVLPLDAETSDSAGFMDPVGDLRAMPVPGVLHKYKGRVLLITTGACAINCRYCFRRHFPYADANASDRQWDAALAYIREDDSVSEVILSGGDPLVLADHKLHYLVARLADIAHVERLRIHSRLPVVLPERVTDGLLDSLAGNRLQTVMVLHANHGAELDASVHAACAALRGAGTTLLNQTVLLRGVNDDTAALEDLSLRLFAMGVLPYYLHALDPVRGAAHFLVSEQRAADLAAELADRLPGYLVPRLVRELAGEPGKTPLTTPRHRETRSS